MRYTGNRLCTECPQAKHVMNKGFPLALSTSKMLTHQKSTAFIETPSNKLTFCSDLVIVKDFPVFFSDIQ